MSDEKQSMTVDQVKEVIFYTLIAVQGFPPSDTQISKWQEAVDGIYVEIAPNLSKGLMP